MELHCGVRAGYRRWRRTLGRPQDTTRLSSFLHVQWRRPRGQPDSRCEVRLPLGGQRVVSDPPGSVHSKVLKAVAAGEHERVPGCSAKPCQPGSGKQEDETAG
jgi:hypothetical protein